jgi:hypothetical protein
MNRLLAIDPRLDGVGVAVFDAEQDLFRLMKLLNAAEADALRLGLVELEDYDEAVIPAPAQLLEAGP